MFSPADGGKRTIVSCHVDKVVSPERVQEFLKGGTILSKVPVATNKDGTIDRAAARQGLTDYIKGK